MSTVRIPLTKHRGWKKTQTAAQRRAKLLASTNHAKTLHNRYLEAGHAAQALANITTDAKTKKEAKADANYFFKKVDKKK